MDAYTSVERLFKDAVPPRSGSTAWYDACDLFATAVKARLRERFKRGFLVEVYGDEVGLILRVRGDGYGAAPWSVDRALDYREPLFFQVEEVLREIEKRVAKHYVNE